MGDAIAAKNDRGETRGHNGEKKGGCEGVLHGASDNRRFPTSKHMTAPAAASLRLKPHCDRFNTGHQAAFFGAAASSAQIRNGCTAFAHQDFS